MTRPHCRPLCLCLASMALGMWASVALCKEARPLPLNPFEVANSLIELGSREGGSKSNLQAAKLLATRLDFGGERSEVKVPSADAPFSTVSARSPGETEEEVVISAHFDTVVGSPGALDNASGCGVVAASYWDLMHSPRHRSLRAVLFDAEESGREGSIDWVQNQSSAGGPSIFAAISAEMVGSSQASVGVIHPITSSRGGRWKLTPAWLIHAALQGARVSNFRVAVSDANWPIFSQMSLRLSKPTITSDSQSFLDAGVPALTISDFSLTESDSDRHSPYDTLDRLDAARLDRWVITLNAIVGQIDHLRDAPLSDTDYLVAAGRVWIRRDLMWVGFLVWIPLVFQGLPGRWRGASTSEKKRRGRVYLPGFAFRMLFLVSVFLIPTLASVLLYPVALVAMIPTRSRGKQQILIGVLALAPLVSFILWLALAQYQGHIVLASHALAPAVLIVLTIVFFWKSKIAPSCAPEPHIGQAPAR